MSWPEWVTKWCGQYPTEKDGKDTVLQLVTETGPVPYCSADDWADDPFYSQPCHVRKKAS